MDNSGIKRNYLCPKLGDGSAVSLRKISRDLGLALDSIIPVLPDLI